MLEYNLPKYLPSAEELPDSDETPVDNDWYDESGKRYPTPQEKIQRLAEKLRSLGIDPDNLD